MGRTTGAPFILDCLLGRFTDLIRISRTKKLRCAPGVFFDFGKKTRYIVRVIRNHRRIWSKRKNDS